MLRPPPKPPLFPSTPLFRSKEQLGPADRDAVAVREHDLRDASPVDVRAVRALEVVQGVPAEAHADLRVLARHAPIVQHDVVLRDRKSTRLNSSHLVISYAVF